MADDDLNQDLPETPDQPEWDASAATPEDLPDRLRVHSLARVLGTTSRRVLDALSELDGRTRSAQSSVDRTDAVRVRDVLAGSDDPTGEDAAEAGDAQAEPESRLMLETAPAEQPGYMPLFVAPQVVEVEADEPDDEDDEDDEDEALDDWDDEDE